VLINQKAIPFASICHNLPDINTGRHCFHNKRIPVTENRFLCYPHQFRSWFLRYERIWAMDGDKLMGRRKTRRCPGRWTCRCNALEGQGTNRKAEERIRMADKESDSPRSSQSTRGTSRTNAAANATARMDRLWATDCPGAGRQSRDEREGQGRKRNETKRIDRIKSNAKVTDDRERSQKVEEP
jgi:hypothetical protein